MGIGRKMNGFRRRGWDIYRKNEQMYASLWTAFCRTISIESRENPRSQMQHLPLRYRPEMTEMAGEV